ncbi:glycoside hydrolase family 31 protein [Streptomyces synnematoformans]|uniref:Glycoside hydrolase family 31 protein n=1 Tax=Streptomyces synnematoformans TaxID=415721 RepID=A0ABP5KYU0_9ACTN
MVSFRPTPTGMEIRHRHEVLTVEAWGADSVRVRAAPFRLPAESHGALDRPPPSPPPRVDADGDADVDRAVLVHGELTVTAAFDRRAAHPEPLLTFTRTSTGAELLAESREHFWLPGARVFRGDGGGGGGAYEIHQQFAAYDGERLHGMGQRTHGRLDLKGLALDLVHRNGEVSIPFVLSSRGYGLLWNLPAVGRAEFAENATRWQAGRAREIDYWLTAAPTPAGILARYADATGHPPELPRWASGFWQSKLRYRDQDELLAVAREHRRRGLPLSVIVADYFHWTAMGDYRFDPAEWPDPGAMVEELAEQGVELMVSVWPTVSPLAGSYPDYRDRGLLAGTAQGVECHQTIQDKGMAAPMPVAFYDPTNPETREFVWERVRRGYRDLGIRVFWLDACEPELSPAQPENLALYAGPGAETAGVYPRDNARLFAEGMAADSAGPAVLLCRSAWAGAQKYGAALWSGDIPATWASLRQQIRAGLAVALSGIPWWTTDIGGFHGGDARDPAYRELLVRWFQFGVFCPLFRLHGDREPRTPTSYAQTGGPNEVWSYGEEAYGIIAGLLHLRERLRPYLHEQMAAAARTGLPPMRPLFVDYPGDPRAWQVDDAFLFGPDVLVAPVAEAGRRDREVYLPAGTRWVCAATGETYDGGGTVTAAAPLDRIPVFTREGADVPLGADTGAGGAGAGVGAAAS